MNDSKSFWCILMMFLFMIPMASMGQKMDKNYKTVYRERTIPVSPQQAWDAVAIEFDQVDNFNHKFNDSEYINNSTVGELGAKRKVTLNKNGKRWYTEEICEWYPETRMYTSKMLSTETSLDPNNTRMTVRVRDNQDGTSTISYTYQYRQNRRLGNGWASQGMKKRDLKDSLYGLDHYLTTGEKNIDKKEWRDIKKDIKKNDKEIAKLAKKNEKRIANSE